MLPAFLRPAPDSIVARWRQCSSNPRLHALMVLWSLWVFLPPLMAPVSASFWWSVALSYPLFVLLFVLVRVRPYDEVGFYASGMALLAVVSMPYNPAAWCYAVFACTHMPYRGSLFATVSRSALIVLLLVLEAWWIGLPWLLVLLMVSICSSAFLGSLTSRLSMMKISAQRMSQKKVRHLAATAERERIGRDLHDLLGHTLSLITLKLELSRKLFDQDHEQARHELADAERIARKALAEVRSAVTGIRGTDLVTELASVHLMLETSGVVVHYEPPAQPLPATVELVLALAVREAATNITRHAKATRVNIEADVDVARVCLCITDNGCGGVSAFGNGLEGIRERVQTLGGNLRIESPRNHGTRLQIEVPLSKPRVQDAQSVTHVEAPVPAVTGRHT